LDAGALSDALIGVLNQNLSETVLDSYAEKRKKVFVDVVNPMSQANVRRLFESDPDTAHETDPFLKMVNDPTVDTSKFRGPDALYVDVMVNSALA